MKEMHHLALQPQLILGAHPEAAQRQVADDRHYQPTGWAAVAKDTFQTCARGRAHQHEYLLAVGQQVLQHTPTDQTGGTREKVGHRRPQLAEEASTLAPFEHAPYRE